MTNLKLQKALFKAAKVGHISLMRELIKVGADPFIPDELGHNIPYFIRDIIL